MVECYETVAQGLDAWLEGLGYKMEGECYRVTGEDTDKTVAMFSHHSSSSAALWHMFNIPFPQFWGHFISIIHLLRLFSFQTKK
jgi:probable phosphoglycerate mutase